MSGGFYGVSWNLANLMISHKNKAAYKIGIEDLQTGRLIQAVARTSRQPINVVSWQNGLLWCHFKHRTNVTWAILSGDSHVWDDCDKRR